MKTLSAGTWLEPDPTWGAWVTMPGGHAEPATPDRWLEAVVAIELRPEAPDHIRSLFEVARAAIAYGAFQYSLMTIGIEQLWRITETLARDAVRRLTGKDPTSFGAAVKALDTRRLLTEREVVQLDAARELRNRASHPTTQQVLMPSNALEDLEFVARWEERFAKLASSAQAVQPSRDECTQWLQKIRDDVYDLVYARRWWDRIGRIVETNDQLPKEDEFYALLGDWYARYVAVGIRRHVDADSRSLSLRRLLERIIASPSLELSASELQASYPAHQAAHHERLPSGWAERHLAELTSTAEPIRRYVNKHVAHLDRAESPATYQDLHEALGAAISAVLAVQLSLTGIAPTPESFSRATEQFDWGRPLRVPWITEKVWLAVSDS